MQFCNKNRFCTISVNESGHYYGYHSTVWLSLSMFIRVNDSTEVFFHLFNTTQCRRRSAGVKIAELWDILNGDTLKTKHVTHFENHTMETKQLIHHINTNLYTMSFNDNSDIILLKSNVNTSTNNLQRKYFWYWYYQEVVSITKLLWKLEMHQ